VHDLQARVSAITTRCAASADRPRVVSIEWLDPLMVGGMWMPELIGHAGGIPLVTRPGDHAPTVTKDAPHGRALAPDVLLVKPCGFPLERTPDVLDLLRTSLSWASWPVAKEGRALSRTS
jgi:iron complex transport system substrate-binding protein